jgi:hypothetical protein
MPHLFDEFSKSLNAPVPRRESLRYLGAVLAGAVLSPLSLGTAWAAGKDPCKAFCRCSNKKQQNACLTACRACNGDTSRVCGRCGTYACCSGQCCGGVCSNLSSDPNCGACGNNCGAIGETCCGSYCADLDDDFYNCGACGNVCNEALPYEQGACIDGACHYACVEGTVECDGVCTAVDWDPNNCGACGVVCPPPGPNEFSECFEGQCLVGCNAGALRCDGVCTPVLWDPNNCGACGNVCGGANPYCSNGQCTNCEGAGGAICNGVCIDVMWDGNNCGACCNVCPPLSFLSLVFLLGAFVY